MAKQNTLTGTRLLLMGSKRFSARRLPLVLRKMIDRAIARKMIIIVGEAPGACRLYQNYLESSGYANVIVGHAKSMRYNAGNWKTKRYGDDVHEREMRMIDECDSAIVVWTDRSGVIAENLEVLKRLEKPTLMYEHSARTGSGKTGWLDPGQTYDPYYDWKEYLRKQKYQKKHSR